MNPLDQLDRSRFFHYFREVSAIPRGSGDEKRISDYVAEFARLHGLEYVQDDMWNVIIYKPACGATASGQPLALQCHMDMVCEKAADSPHDFTKDPIRLQVEDGFLTAVGTTLGCDNGMGMAYILAVLESDQLTHPPIEAIFTTNEEVGLEGMAELDVNRLQATRMINIDAEEEGVFVTSCAGGARLHLELPVTCGPVQGGAQPFQVTIDHLTGGHSGLDIGRGRANAIQLLGRTLKGLGGRYDLQVGPLSGGAKTNSIPRRAEAVLWLQEDEAALVRQELVQLQGDYRREFAQIDPHITITLVPIAGNGPVLEPDSLQRVLAGILLSPCGALSYSPHLPGVVDCSCSVGILEMDSDTVNLTSMARANVNSKMEDTVQRSQLLAEQLGGVFYTRNRYSAWEYQADSSLRPVCDETYRQFSGKEPCFESIHAGLECALMAGKRPEMDMISMGPNIFDAHTPSERVEIASLLRMWQYLVLLLESL